MSTSISSRTASALYRADLLDAVNVLLLVLTCAGLLLLTNPAGNFPIVDDWIYAVAVQNLLDTGRFALANLSAANVIAQVYWGALFCLPLGFSYEALRLSTAVLAVVGVAASYLLFRELGGTRRASGIGALTLAANPIYIQLSDSFMTDVPFAAALSVSFWLYARGVRRDNAVTIAAAFAVAAAALLIRQFALLMPIAFGAAYVARRGFGWKTLVLAMLPVAGFLALHLGYQHWMTATGRTPMFVTRVDELLRFATPAGVRRMALYGAQMLPYFGAFCAPLFVYLLAAKRLSIHPRLSNRGFAVAGLILGALLFLVLVSHDDGMPEFGNHLTVHGFGPLLLSDTWFGTHPVHEHLPVLPGAATFWTAMTALGCWVTACACLLGAARVVDVVRSLRRRAELARLWPVVMLLTFLAGYVAALLLIGGLKFVFDRYLLPTIVPLCALLLLSASGSARPRLSQLAPAAALLVGFAVLSVLGTHDWMAWNRARWAAIHSLLDQGVAPTDLDAGFEFNGAQMYTAEGTVNDQQPAPDRFQYRILAAPAPGYDLVRTLDFPRWLWPDSYALLVLRRQGG